MPRLSIEFLQHIFDEIEYLVSNSKNLDKDKFLQDETPTVHLCEVLKSSARHPRRFRLK